MPISRLNRREHIDVATDSKIGGRSARNVKLLPPTLRRDNGKNCGTEGCNGSANTLAGAYERVLLPSYPALLPVLCYVGNASSEHQNAHTFGT